MIDVVVSVCDELNEAKGHVGEVTDKEQSNAWWIQVSNNKLLVNNGVLKGTQKLVCVFVLRFSRLSLGCGFHLIDVRVRMLGCTLRLTRGLFGVIAKCSPGFCTVRVPTCVRCYELYLLITVLIIRYSSYEMRTKNCKLQVPQQERRKTTPTRVPSPQFMIYTGTKRRFY